MTQRLKRWESPRKDGRNDKGRGGSARQRQKAKQLKALRLKLKQNELKQNESQQKELKQNGQSPNGNTASGSQSNRHHPAKQPNQKTHGRRKIFSRSFLGRFVLTQLATAITIKDNDECCTFIITV
ncbi:MAG: hypothetical protein VKL39_01130 [Leptolyngbyaceae bacterium]|nr:hypothetical protein [Leptolyngbyaceae bacterium]